jgi:hypothetical protein
MVERARRQGGIVLGGAFPGGHLSVELPPGWVRDLASGVVMTEAFFDQYAEEIRTEAREHIERAIRDARNAQRDMERQLKDGLAEIRAHRLAALLETPENAAEVATAARDLAATAHHIAALQRQVAGQTGRIEDLRERLATLSRGAREGTPDGTV